MEETQKEYNKYREIKPLKSGNIFNQPMPKKEKKFNPKEWGRLHENIHKRDIAERKSKLAESALRKKEYKQTTAYKIESAIEKYGKKKLQNKRLLKSGQPTIRI